MAATHTPEDSDLNRRLARMFETNPEFAADYFRQGTGAWHGSPTERNDHARHQEALAHVEGLLQQEEAARRARDAVPPASSRIGTEREIRELMDSPSYGNSRDANHASTMDRIGWLYRSLNPPKED